MAVTVAPVRKLVVEWKYEPQLGFYSQMDEVGIRFADMFPDWRRAALALELWNKERHCRFFMSFNRCFYEVIDPLNISEDLRRACNVFERLANAVQIEKVNRMGIRQWTAFNRAETFKKLMRLSARKFQPKSDELDQILGGNLEDVSYVVAVQANEGWEYDLRLGPMEKLQWFEILQHDPNLFRDASQLEEYKAAFPEAFLYIDIDASKKDLPVVDCRNLVTIIRERSNTIMLGLNDYLTEG